MVPVPASNKNSMYLFITLHLQKYVFEKLGRLAGDQHRRDRLLINIGDERKQFGKFPTFEQLLLRIENDETSSLRISRIDRSGS
jgi:hypothetical protein